MDQTILDWLLEENNPEVRLRTLKEYKRLPEDDKALFCAKRNCLAAKFMSGDLRN